MVRWMAFFWGLMLFMPVGMNYLAFVLLLVVMLAQGQVQGRVLRLRQSPAWWPGVFFLGWTLVVLAIQPVYYPETAANLFHGLRIVATLTIALALTRDEASWALRGFVIGGLASLLIIAIHLLANLPPSVISISLVRYGGNKSLSNAVLFSLLGAWAFIMLLETRNMRHRVLALLLTVACVAVIVWVLPSRTSLLIMVLSLLAASIHRLRRHRLRAAAAIAAVFLSFTFLVAMQPKMQERFALGLIELQQARSGVITNSSWGVRYTMNELTSKMMLERPLTGWGIGSWNRLWTERAPENVRGFNMPHNDYLWMGAQAGLPGLLGMLALVLSGLGAAWQRRGPAGQLGLVAVLTLAFAAVVNSALRDAAIGLSLIFVVGVLLRLAISADEPDPPGG